ncbi:MAG: hypothetical protein UT30_C0033G0012 [Candidatus Uhrbacteria bacterium GW2011_GWF2_39_13]|uniref:Uncharacterized protein n=1 Tax=Candidatus Uhrbacteria bacterium GW2011_GWF2_39_13 TaxID=1618995 RepID=A0A0G0MS84_9BACT|nr:MAG: hypothetical protein UT30_C0033G0012 [Candidatus Uhrbacteria bacterium GW2011_GWF2_39_13]
MKIPLYLFLIISLVPINSFGETFAIEREKNNKIIIKTEDLTVTVNSCSRFRITTKFAAYTLGAYNRMATVVTEKITVAKDDENVKRIELSSKPFSVKDNTRKFNLSLEVRKNLPGILFIESEVFNLSEYPSDCYFSWSIPLHSIMYVTEDGDTVISTSKREEISENWLFFPETDSKGGFGIIVNSKNIVMRYHNTNSWLIQGNIPKTAEFKSIEKGQSNKINFTFLSVQTEKEVKKYHTILKSDNQ